MEHFTVEGRWWLPADPQRQVPGTLAFDGDQLELVLYGGLRAFEMPENEVVRADTPDWSVDPIVHGTTRDGQEYTLFEVGGANFVGPFGPDREVYRPALALAGRHTAADDFSEAWCRFDFLDAWANPPDVVSRGEDRGAVQVRVDSVDLANADIGDATVTLVSGVEGTTGGERVQLSRWTAFVVRPTEPRAAQVLIGDYARALQDLLMLCLGRTVRLTSLRLRPTDQAEPREGPSDAFFAAVQPAATQTPTAADIEGYSARQRFSLCATVRSHSTNCSGAGSSSGDVIETR